MPKMPDSLAAKTEEAKEWTGRGPVEPGFYPGRLVKVEVRPGQKAPYWSWEFDLLGDADGKKVWHTTSTSEKALGGMKRTFNAFQASADTDTDDLIGDVIGLDIGVEMSKPKNPGDLPQKRNVVLDVLPWEGDEYSDGDDFDGPEEGTEEDF